MPSRTFVRGLSCLYCCASLIRSKESKVHSLIKDSHLSRRMQRAATYIGDAIDPSSERLRRPLITWLPRPAASLVPGRCNKVTRRRLRVTRDTPQREPVEAAAPCRTTRQPAERPGRLARADGRSRPLNAS